MPQEARAAAASVGADLEHRIAMVAHRGRDLLAQVTWRFSTSPTGTRSLPVLSAAVAARSSGTASKDAGRVRLAWTLTILITIGGVTGVILWARSGFRPPPHVFFLGPVPYLALVATLVSQGACALILTVRRPANLVSWLILAFAAAVMLGVLTNGYLALSSTGWGGPFEPAWAALLFSVSYLATGVTVAIAIGHVFPDGHLISPTWRLGILAGALGSLVYTIGIALTPGPLATFPTYDNPLNPAVDPVVPWLARVVLGPVLMTAGAISTAAALVERYRMADHIGRLQVRGYAASGVGLVVAFVAYVVAVLSLPPSSSVGEWVVTLVYLGAAVPPFFLVFAILRYRLYEIDTIIGRAVVYGLLTAILAGIYSASIRLFNALFVNVTGETSELALVITTLILATTFTPIKGRLERIVAERMKNEVSAEAEPAPDGASGTRSGEPDLDPIEARARAVAAMLEDPVFVAALDARVKAIVEGSGPLSGSPPPE